MLDLAALTPDDFSPHTGSTFDLEADDTLRLALKLAEVTTRNAASKPNDNARRSFSLLFTASLDAPVLPQRLYHLNHAGLGTLDVFLVPIGPKDDAMQYEAIFN